MDLLSRRLAVHSRNGIPAIGLLVCEEKMELPGTFWVHPEALAQTLSAVVHNLFAPCLLGIVCVDWDEALSILDLKLPLAISFAQNDDAGALGRQLASAQCRTLTAAHAVLYAPFADLRLKEIRAFANGIRPAMAEGAQLVYSAPAGARSKARYWGCLVGAAAS